MDLVTLISNNGFAIGVAIYLLVTGSKERKEMTTAINELRIAVIALQKIVMKNSPTQEEGAA